MCMADLAKVRKLPCKMHQPNPLSRGRTPCQAQQAEPHQHQDIPACLRDLRKGKLRLPRESFNQDVDAYTCPQPFVHKQSQLLPAGSNQASRAEP